MYHRDREVVDAIAHAAGEVPEDGSHLPVVEADALTCREKRREAQANARAVRRNQSPSLLGLERKHEFWEPSGVCVSGTFPPVPLHG